jgi:hypothetical protein
MFLLRQLRLPQFATQFSEDLIEWRQYRHLVRESRGPQRLQPRFLFDDCLLDSGRRLLAEGEFARDRSAYAWTTRPSDRSENSS